jgi:Type IV secretion-system coupling protein DNA-binding domain
MPTIVDSQTRVRSTFPAFVAGLPAAVFFFSLEIWELFALFPVEGWTPASDSPVKLGSAVLATIYHYVNANVTWPHSIGDYVIFLPHWLGLWLGALSYYQILIPAVIRLGVSVWVGWRCGQLIYKAVHRKTLALPSVHHVRGPRPLYGGLGIAHLNERWSDRRALEKPDAIKGLQLAPGAIMPVDVETEHFLLFGKPGGGKSVILENLAWQAIRRGDRVLMVDVKGNLPRRVRRRFKTLVPRVLGLAGAKPEAWDVGRDIKSRADAAELAAILIKETRDPIWSDGSRLILVGIIGGLVKKYGAKWGWKHLHKVLGTPLEVIEEEVLKNSPEVQQLLRRSGKDPSNAMLSLLMTLIANVGEISATLAAVEAAAQKRFSIRAWAENKAGNAPVIIRHDQSRPEQAKVFARLIIAIMGRALLSDAVQDEFDHRIWLFVDELPRLGRIDMDDLAALARSRGVRLVCSIQSLAQLKQVGGADFADAFVENFGIRIVTQLSSGEAAKTISGRWIGERLVRNAVQVGKESSPVSAPVIEPADLVGELGLNFSVLGRPYIKAVVLGVGDIPILNWPIKN